MRESPLVLVIVALGCVERVEVLSPAPEEPEGSPSVSDVALGEAHGCAVSRARLYCWGENGFGELGTGDLVSSLRPVLVSVGGSWTRVTAGAHHTCALDDRGGVACWGANERGQLGTGDRESRSSPSFVELPSRATFVVSDFSHTCALLADATLHCWGKNDEGELGQDDAFPGDQSTDADALLPVVVPGAFRAVETGQGHTCAIRLDGRLLCWGRNTEHELGEDGRQQVRAPLEVGTEADWLAVEAGQSHTCGLRQDLHAYCWGQNTGIETGGGAPLGIAGATLVTVPALVDAASDLTLLRSDTFHGCAIDRDARLFCWGRGTEGQLGLGDKDLREVPTLVGTGYLAVAVGRFTTCAVAVEGSLSCAGKNDVGQLGTDDTMDRSTLTPVEFPAP
jgi:alpha-tubulin suppressor-like RCC1 family protein